MNNEKEIKIPCHPGDEIYIVDNKRHWAQIATMRIYNDENGNLMIVCEWEQRDVGVDDSEVYDEGEFDISEIGNKVLLKTIHGEHIKKLQKQEKKQLAEIKRSYPYIRQAAKELIYKLIELAWEPTSFVCRGKYVSVDTIQKVYNELYGGDDNE